MHVCGIRLELGGTGCFFYPVSDLRALLHSRSTPAVASVTAVAQGRGNFLFKETHLNTSQGLTVVSMWKSEALQAAVTMALHSDKRCRQWC